MNSAKSSSCGNRLARRLRRSFCSVATLTIALVTCALTSLAQIQQPTTIFQQSPDLQSAGTIRGTVVDGTRAEVVGARVTLTRKDQSLNQQTVSGSDGQFTFVSIAPGDFQITITATGFASQTISGTLQPGQIYIATLSALAPATANTAVQVTATQNDIAEAQVKIQEKQRMVGFFPNFYVSYVPDPVPLGKKQKFELAWKTMIDPATIIVTGVTAGIQQSQNSYAGYGQGAQGYAKRFGASYADDATDTFIGGVILPSLLKQDPRYYYKGTGSKRSRALYAIAQVVICKGDNKHWQPNYSGILGSLASGGISNLYYPAADRGASLTFNNTLIGMGSSAGINLLQEFVIRKFTSNVQKPDPAKP